MVVAGLCSSTRWLLLFVLCLFLRHLLSPIVDMMVQVIDMGGEAISSNEYLGVGKVTEFRSDLRDPVQGHHQYQDLNDNYKRSSSSLWSSDMGWRWLNASAATTLTAWGASTTRQRHNWKPHRSHDYKLTSDLTDEKCTNYDSWQ